MFLVEFGPRNPSVGYDPDRIVAWRFTPDPMGGDAADFSVLFDWQDEWFVLATWKNARELYERFKNVAVVS